MAKLKIIWPDNREQEFEIKKDTIVIGRTGDNDLKLSDTGISRRQCKIEGSPGNYSIVDLDSKKPAAARPLLPNPATSIFFPLNSMTTSVSAYSRPAAPSRCR